jgi:hypothetical protein
MDDGPSPIITPPRDQDPELGSGEEEGEIIPGSPEDKFVSDDTTSLESLLRGIPPPGEATQTEAAAGLLDGINDLSAFEPTPSVQSYSRRDCRPGTFDPEVGLWYHAPVEEHQCEETAPPYKEVTRVQANRVREGELQYGWELVQKFIEGSTWTSAERIGKELNHLVSNICSSICCTQWMKADKITFQVWRSWRDRLGGVSKRGQKPHKGTGSPPEMETSPLACATSECRGGPTNAQVYVSPSD